MRSTRFQWLPAAADVRGKRLDQLGEHGRGQRSIYIPSYGLLSASVMYQPSDQHWNARIYGTNLTDKYYVLGGYNIPALGNLSAVTVGIRRMFGLQFNYMFK